MLPVIWSGLGSKRSEESLLSWNVREESGFSLQRQEKSWGRRSGHVPQSREGEAGDPGELAILGQRGGPSELRTPALPIEQTGKVRENDIILLSPENIFLNYYFLFVTVLHLCCCTWPFSSCGE